MKNRLDRLSKKTAAVLPRDKSAKNRLNRLNRLGDQKLCTVTLLRKQKMQKIG